MKQFQVSEKDYKQATKKIIKSIRSNLKKNKRKI